MIPRSAQGFLLENAALLTHLSETQVKHQSLAIVQNRIAAIGKPDELRSRFPDLQRVDLKGYLLTPGLFNAHAHASMSFFRGLAPLQDPASSDSQSLVERFFFPMEKALTPDMIEALAYPYIVDALKSGTTSINDAYFFILGLGKACERIGLRAAIGEHIADLGGPHPAGLDHWKSYRKSIESWPFSSLVSPVVYAHATDTVSHPLLKELGAYAKSAKLPFHMHLSQSVGERRRVFEREGQAPVPYALSAGVIHERSLLVHLVSAREEDIAIIKGEGAVACLCPVSEVIYEKLPELQLFADPDLRLALGTDCAASNDGADMWQEARSFWVFMKDRGLDLPTQRLGASISSEGQEVFWPGQLGRLEEGRIADLLCLKLGIEFEPMHHPLNTLVFSGASRAVKHVMVDGRFVLWNGELALVKEDDLRAEFHKTLAELRRLSPVFPTVT